MLISFKGSAFAYTPIKEKLCTKPLISQYNPPTEIKIIMPKSEKNFPIIEICDCVVGSITIAEESPICILIISPAAETISKIQCAIKPSIEPKTKFKTKDKINELP